MNEVFGSVYANSYDVFYRDKDYAAECALIEDIFQKYGKGSIRSVLDLGCGTGNHAIPLARHGYEVAGVERSESMLAHARRKAEDALPGRALHFQQGDIRDVDLGKQFDAALMMFAVLGYQVENADVLAALRTARRHLRPGGLLVFDVWYGPAVLRERPSQRVKVIPTNDGKILRAASGTVDSARHLCTVDYLVWQIARGKAVAEGQESHTMRYFFPRELELVLECTGFDLLRLGAFPDFQRDPDDSTWNVMAVAKAMHSS
jgi:SAM-dependent methyltransferase